MQSGLVIEEGTKITDLKIELDRRVRASIAGFVRRRRDGSPVSGAHVCIERFGPDLCWELEGGPEAVTTETGEFRFLCSPGLPVSLRVSVPGGLYKDVTTRACRAGGDRVLVELDDAAIVEGMLVSTEGDPRPGARVIIEGPDGESEVLTDDDGRFRAEGLSPGDYAVAAVPPEGEGAEEHGRVRITLAARDVRSIHLTTR